MPHLAGGNAFRDKKTTPYFQIVFVTVSTVLVHQKPVTREYILTAISVLRKSASVQNILGGGGEVTSIDSLYKYKRPKGQSHPC